MSAKQSSCAHKTIKTSPFESGRRCYKRLIVQLMNKWWKSITKMNPCAFWRGLTWQVAFTWQVTACGLQFDGLDPAQQCCCQVMTADRLIVVKSYSLAGWLKRPQTTLWTLYQGSFLGDLLFYRLRLVIKSSFNHRGIKCGKGKIIIFRFFLLQHLSLRCCKWYF